MMKKTAVSIFFCVISLAVAFGQGTVRGKVSDEDGEPIPFALVQLTGETPTNVMTDLNGDYEVKVPANVPQTLLFYSMGFDTVRVQITVKEGEIKIQNTTMGMSSTMLSGAVIEIYDDKSSDAAANNKTKNAGQNIEVLSFEAMNKSGDNNLSAAIQRVPGVSTVSGFVSVRGLADRYVVTAFNGARIPTLDPLTNNVKLDIFPANMVDNITIYKTQSPKLPGDWSGAFVSVESRNYPEKLLLNYTTSFTYNNNVSFREVLRSDGSSTDWLGYDDGFRDAPDDLTNLNLVPSLSTSWYEKFSVLGIGDQLTEYGVTEGTNDNLVRNLGLVEMGYLSSRDVGDQMAVDLAQAEFEAEYPQSFFDDQDNDSQAEFLAKNNSFNNNSWFPFKRNAPVMHSHSLAFGNQTRLLNRKLGYMFAFRYANGVRYDDEATLIRFQDNALKTQSTELQSDGVYIDQAYNAIQDFSRISNTWSFMANISYRLSSNHSIRVLFMPNFWGENFVRHAEGILDVPNKLTNTINQVYVERKRLLYQASTKHFFPKTEIRLTSNVSYSKGDRNDLDFRELAYNNNVDLTDGSLSTINLGNFDEPKRSWRELSENQFNAGVDLNIPIVRKWDESLKRSFITGVLLTDLSRKADAIGVNLNVRDPEGIYTGDEYNNYLQDLIFDRENRYSGGENDGSIEEDRIDEDEYIGRSQVQAAYGMLDVEVVDRIRLMGGVRFEKTLIASDNILFYDNKISYNDPIRAANSGGFYVPGFVDRNDWLPSVNLIYRVRGDKKKPLNLRLSYGKSLSRPTIRELTSVQLYDFYLADRLGGNPFLKTTTIHNYDIRIEKYERKYNTTLSFFYKDIQNHIQFLERPDGFYWDNAPSSSVYGLEIEGALSMEMAIDTVSASEGDVMNKYIKPFWNNLSISGNVTLIRSRSVLLSTFSNEELTHPMFGQAPYLINATISYNSDALGLIVTTSYNVQGEKLAILKATGDLPDLVNVFEMPRHMVDVKISKRLGQHFKVGLKMRNLLNQPFVRAYAFDDGYIDFDRYRYGTYYSFSIGYSL